MAGFKEPEWYSPGSQGVGQPLVDLEVLRQSDSQNRFDQIHLKFHSKLIQKHILYRRAGTDQWFFGVGCLDGALGVGWPASMTGDRVARFNGRAKRQLHFIFGPAEWEAVQVSWCSPLRQAIRQELQSPDVAGAAASPEFWESKEVSVKDSTPV